MPFAFQKENEASKAGGNRWLPTLGACIDEDKNLKWRRNWYQILRKANTIGFLVCLDTTVGRGEHNNAERDVPRQDFDSMVPQEVLTVWNQNKSFWILADQ